MWGGYTLAMTSRRSSPGISQNGAKSNEVTLPSSPLPPRRTNPLTHYKPVRVLNSRGVAFITYTNEASSQFAKEAMAHQSLDHNEILNVRWATVDPNPIAQAREKRKIEEQAAEAVRRALPADFVAEIEGKDPEARKRKRIEGSFGLTGYDAPDEVWYARGSTAANPSGRQNAAIESSKQHLPAITEAGREEEDGGGGIISESTLAALKSYSTQNKSGIITSQASKAVVPSGPLVAYGSDDDSD
jgi:hypothetical protein